MSTVIVNAIGLMLSQLSRSGSMQGLAIVAPDDPSSSIKFDHAEVLMNEERWLFNVCSSLGFLFPR